MRSKFVPMTCYFWAVAAIACLPFRLEAQQRTLSDAPTNSEYVVSVPSVHRLRGILLTEVDSVLTTTPDLVPDITGVSMGAVKVTVFDQDEDNAEVRVDVCNKLRKTERRKRQEYRARKRSLPPRVYSCAPNGTLKISGVTPNDSMYSLLWGMNQANDVDINMPQAWELSTGNPSVVIAVIDSGVDYNHPDLAANMWRNPGEIPGNGVDDDANGVIDDVFGYNAITGSGNPMDDNSHGTHCAGTIAGKGNNGFGVVGVNWNAQIMAVKFLNGSGSGNLFDAIRAIDYTTGMRDRGINVVLSSNSWGGGGYWTPLRDAIVRNSNAGMIFVAAAGNSSHNNDVPDGSSYPSAYDVSNIVSVAAIDQNGGLAYFSNYGANSVDIGAPGVMIQSTTPNGNYEYKSGTSMATPHVSGALGLLIGRSPGLSVSEYINILLTTGKPLSSLSGKVKSGKLMNVYAMLNAAAPVTPTPTPTSTQTPTPGPPTSTPTATFTPTTTPTPTATSTPTSTPTPKPYDISGRVVDKNGVGISGAIISVASSRGQTGVAQSGAGGNYIVPAILGPSSYQAAVTAPGQTFIPYSGVLPDTTTVNFVAVENQYSISGKVVSPSGTGLAGIQVRLVESNATVTTDSQGRFSFSLPRDSAYHIQLVSASYDMQPSEFVGTVTGNIRRISVGRTG